MEDAYGNSKEALRAGTIVRGLQTMWAGDAASPGSLFREFVITSNELNSTQGKFQVYGLEGASGGIKDADLSLTRSQQFCSIKILMVSIRRQNDSISQSQTRNSGDSNQSRWRFSNSKTNYAVPNELVNSVTRAFRRPWR